MENELKFNSQICTTKEQSQRLLDLGLKPETGDCMYSVMTKSYNGHYILEEDRQYNLILFRQEEVQNVGLCCYKHIPAWSLHRLMEILDAPLVEFSISTLEEAYEDIIYNISESIKNGYINKEYLK